VTILVANKSDLDPSERKVTEEQGEQLASELGIQWFATSAKTGDNVENAFITLSSEVKKKIIDRVETDSDEELLDEDEILGSYEGDQKKKKKNCVLL
jgi:Ras-related protein Rab-8A